MVMDHQLNWTPGQEGKGFILLDGTLYTWDCSGAGGNYPAHVEKERQYGIQPAQIGAYLIIEADGRVFAPHSPKREMIHEVPKIDPRLWLNKWDKEWSFSKVGVDFNPEVAKGIEIATPFEYEPTQPVRTPFLTTEDENDAIKIWVGRPSSAHASLIRKYDLDYRDEMIMEYGWMNQDEVGFYTEGYDHDKIVEALSQYTGVQFKHMSRDKGTWTFGHIAAIDYSQYANPKCKYCYGSGYFFDGDQDVPCRMCIKGLQPQTDLRVREKDRPSRKQLKDRTRIPTLDLRQSAWTFEANVKDTEEHYDHWGNPCNCNFKRAGFQKEAGKLHDFLMNPKSRPDLQTPEGQDWLKYLAKYKPASEIKLTH